jgi:hypothetical protein
MPNMEDETVDIPTMVYTWWSVENALRARRDEILNAIEQGKVSPTSDVMSELAGINTELGEA